MAFCWPTPAALADLIVCQRSASTSASWSRYSPALCQHTGGARRCPASSTNGHHQLPLLLISGHPRWPVPAAKINSTFNAPLYQAACDTLLHWSTCDTPLYWTAFAALIQINKSTYQMKLDTLQYEIAWYIIVLNTAYSATHQIHIDALLHQMQLHTVIH